MNCKGTVEMLSAYLDRELGSVERDAVRAHLADCETCRTEERDLRSLKGLLLGVRAPEPAEDFERRLLSRLHEEAARPVATRIALPQLRPIVWGQLGGLAAAASLALVVGLSTRPTVRNIVVEPKVGTAKALVRNDLDLDALAQHNEAYWLASDSTGAPLMSNPDAP